MGNGEWGKRRNSPLPIPHSPLPIPSMIHQTAIISSRARLGAKVTVGPYSIIGDHVTIHDDVEIDGHVVIEGPCEIGECTRIYPFASVGQPPQDLKFRGEETRLVIGRRNVIRECVTMNRGTAG